MIRIFVGTSANGEDAESCAVLEYTLRKHAGEELDITWMALSRDPSSPFYSALGNGWDTSQWATPFSGFRWAVPELCGFEGRAIYIDSDFIVQADIAALWGQSFEKYQCVLAKTPGRLCISLWDCKEAASVMAPLKWFRRDPNQHRAMSSFMRAHPLRVGVLAGDWNCLDGERYPDITTPEAIHYTRMATQPHLRHAIPRLRARGLSHWFDGEYAPHWRSDLTALFDTLLDEAIAAGFTPERYEPAEPFGAYDKKSVAHMKGGVKPSWAA